jgi:hypothetical protein
MGVWQTFVRHYANQAVVKNLKLMLGDSQNYFENGVYSRQTDLPPELAQELVAVAGQVFNVGPVKAELLGYTAQLRWSGGTALQAVEGSTPKGKAHFFSRSHGESLDVSLGLFYSPNTNPGVSLRRQATYTGTTLDLALDYWTLGSGYWWEAPLASAPVSATSGMQYAQDADGTRSNKSTTLSLNFEITQVVPAGTETLQLLLQDAQGNRAKR